MIGGHSCSSVSVLGCVLVGMTLMIRSGKSNIDGLGMGYPHVQMMTVWVG